MAVIGYARCSTSDQNTVSQKEELTKAGVELIIEEHESGAKRERRQLNMLLDCLQPNDTLVVFKLDRLSRSLRDLLEINEILQDKGVHLRSTSQQIDTSSAMGRCYFSIIGAIAELELEQIRERAAIGLEVARKNGKLIGRPKKFSPEKIALAKTMAAQGLPKSEIVKALDISRSRLYELLVS